MNNSIPFTRSEIGLCLFAVILTGMIIYNGFYSHPMADDFCFVQKVDAQLGWLDTVLNEYQTWGGRYTTTALISIYIQYFELVRDFWLVCIFLILLSLFSFYVFFSSLRYFGCARKDWMLWLAFAWSFYLCSMSAMPEVLYWLSGGVTYAGGYSFVLIVAGLMLRLSLASYSGLKFVSLALVTSLLIVLTSGFNEVAAVLQVVMIMFGVIFVRKLSNRVRLVWGLAFLLALAALALSAIAPGNYVRMTVLESHHMKWFAPFYGLYQGMGVIIASTILMYLVTSNSLMLPVVQRLSRAWSDKIAALSRRDKAIAIFFIVALFSSVFMPSYWAEGGSPAKRTETILFILPVLVWVPFLGFVSTYPRLGILNYPWMKRYKIPSNIISSVVILLIFVSLNAKNVVLDDTGRANAYDQQLQTRYQLIDEARREGRLDLVVPALTVIPKSLFFGDILTDASHWRNTCYAAYFHLNSIKLASDSPDT